VIFNLIVRYLIFLKQIPLLPWLFDALLLIGNYCFKRSLVLSIEEIEDEVARWEGVTTSIHRYGGLQFNYHGLEIGHIHSNGLLDILFDRKVKSNLIAAGGATDHHVFPQSGWISFQIERKEDVIQAIALLKLKWNLKQKYLQ